MRGWIFGAVNAKADDALFYKRLKFEKDDIIICADGGYNTATLIGIVPHIVIGDMDSISGAVPSSIKKIVYPKNKDKTDLHLCIDYALENGCKEIILLNSFGGRIDHSIAALVSLKYIMENNAEGMLVTKSSKAFLTDEKATIKRSIYSKISLVPLTDTVSGVTTSGLQYPLENATLHQSANMGISNAFSSGVASVEIKEGLLFIICEED
ncbi:MAG: thiamine diphosphokinase [Firmicutes bacterium]|nr:thiamine diphosphokinase [Bacillota bacterium]